MSKIKYTLSIALIAHSCITLAMKDHPRVEYSKTGSMRVMTIYDKEDDSEDGYQTPVSPPQSVTKDTPPPRSLYQPPGPPATDKAKETWTPSIPPPYTAHGRRSPTYPHDHF